MDGNVNGRNVENAIDIARLETKIEAIFDSVNEIKKALRDGVETFYTMRSDVSKLNSQFSDHIQITTPLMQDYQKVRQDFYEFRLITSNKLENVDNKLSDQKKDIDSKVSIKDISLPWKLVGGLAVLVGLASGILGAINYIHVLHFFGT